MNRVARWRILVAVIILAGLTLLAAVLTPIYIRNLQLRSFVSSVAHRVESRTQSDGVLRASVLARARQLELPVKEDDVQVIRSTSGLRIEVRYFVRVDLPGYTVDLHFAPTAGSR